MYYLDSATDLQLVIPHRHHKVGMTSVPMKLTDMHVYIQSYGMYEGLYIGGGGGVCVLIYWGVVHVWECMCTYVLGVCVTYCEGGTQTHDVHKQV